MTAYLAGAAFGVLVGAVGAVVFVPRLLQHVDRGTTLPAPEPVRRRVDRWL